MDNEKDSFLKPENPQKNHQQRNYVCNHCKRIGHKIYTCRYLKREKKEKQNLLDKEKDQKFLLMQENIQNRLTELSETVTHILHNVANLAETIKNRILTHISSPNDDNEVFEIAPTSQKCHQPQLLKQVQEPLPQNCPSPQNKLKSAQKLDNDEFGKRIDEEKVMYYDKVLSDLENKLKPLEFDLKGCVLFKHPPDNIEEFLEEEKDPRLMLFRRHTKTLEFSSVFSKLSHDSIRYEKINRWYELLNHNDLNWFLDFEERINRKTEEKRKSRTQKRKHSTHT